MNMQQLNRTLGSTSASPIERPTSRAPPRSTIKRIDAYVISNRQQRFRTRSHLLATICQFFNFAILSMPSSYFILMIFCFASYRGTLVQAQDSSNSTTLIAPAPHAAALASPGAGGGSSILEQFSPNCTAVSHIFQARGIDQADIPQKPSNEMVLRYCESPSVGTCCTYNMETRMALQSRIQLEKQSKEQITKMSNSLAAKAQKFNSIFRKLLSESKEEFHNMFTRTYGVIYQQNSYVFSDLFNELESYYTRGRVDLLEVMDKFFNTLYQKMFQVLNGQYSFDEKFLHCVSEHMKELKPFGDVPDKLAVQIKRSFVATRTYWQALHTAAEVSKKIVNIHLNADCTAALTKMQHCGACKGYAEKPCTNYCVNVIKGCLHYVNEFDTEWESFALAMDKVAERLLGSFNIVMVVEPINIKISEAIMNFQESGQSITSRVFEGCGRPTLGRRRRSISPKFTHTSAVQPYQRRQSSVSLSSSDSKVIRKRAILEVPVEQIESDILDIDADVGDAIVLRERRAAEPISEEKNAGGDKSNGGSVGSNGGGGGSSGGGGGRRNQQQRRKQQHNRKNEDDYNGRDPNLDKLVREIRQRVKESKKFWSNLPHQICSNDEISTSSDVDGMCWNGHTIDRYMHPVTTEQSRNPEFPGNPSSTRQTSQVATQLYYLKNVINHLRNAYNGQDVDWSDNENSFDGSGAGSGAGSDDEDDDEGSGLSGPYTPPHMKPTDRPSLPANNIDDEDEEDVEERRITETEHTSRPKYTGSSGTSGGVATGGDTNSIEEDGDEDGDNDLDEEKSNGGGASAKSAPQMTLRRALLMYLLPLYMAWFGGIVADLL